MERPLISVIVPVYRVEAYLQTCVDSILGQTYPNLEILLVDDGSPDRCGQICESYAAADTRVRVIHQENGGVSKARNTGLDVCSGAYLCFIDSDDFIDRHYIEVLYSLCAENGADMSMCRMVRTIDGTVPVPNLRGPVRLYSGREMSVRLHSDATGNYAVICNKLFRRKLFESLRFPSGRRYEDEYVVHQYFWASENVAITQAALYVYRQREDSFTGSAFTSARLDALSALEERLRFYAELEDPELEARANAVYCYLMRRCLPELRKLEKPAHLSAQLKKKLRRSFWRLCLSKDLPAKKKASIVLHMISPAAYRLAHTIYCKDRVEEI
jgi:glycosyltransferase involved in cell wall biosynthesis